MNSFLRYVSRFWAPVRSSGSQICFTVVFRETCCLLTWASFAPPFLSVHSCKAVKGSTYLWALWHFLEPLTVICRCDIVKMSYVSGQWCYTKICHRCLLSSWAQLYFLPLLPPSRPFEDRINFKYELLLLYHPWWQKKERRNARPISYHPSCSEQQHMSTLRFSP